MKPAATLCAACAAAAMGGCAQAPATTSAPGATTARDCFHARSVSGFTPRGNDLVDVKVGANRHYRLQLAGVCPNVNWTQRLALLSRGSNWVCQGYDAELVVPTPGLGPQRCMVRNVRRLSEAEVQALRPR